MPVPPSCQISNFASAFSPYGGDEGGLQKNSINRSGRGRKRKENGTVQKIRQCNGGRRPFEKRGESQKPDE